MNCENIIISGKRTPLIETCSNTNTIYHDVYKIYLCSFCLELFDAREEIERRRKDRIRYNKASFAYYVVLTSIYLFGIWWFSK